MFDGYSEKDVIAFRVKDFMDLAKDIEATHNELVDKRSKTEKELESMTRQILSYKVAFEIIGELFKKGEKIEMPDSENKLSDTVDAEAKEKLDEPKSLEQTE